MAQYTRDLFKPGNFTLAFEQMCNFAAIAKTRNADETLRQLILQCFVVFPKEKFQNAAQLTDAITIFGLQMPEYQVQIQKKLNQLTLFLDTNFLFDILDIRGERTYQIEISNELVDIIIKHKLPFKLRYHQATHQEMRATIASLGSELRTQMPTQAFSRAASYSPLADSFRIDSEQQRRNGAPPIDADSFRKRYEHVDILLRNKNILVYRSRFEGRHECAGLLEEYRQFLDSRGRPKPYETMNHDITVLDTVHQLRSKAKSSLEAGALFITCDNLLYMFDWQTSHQQDRPACAVLPNHFLQVLLPFVPSNADFERSFEETFVVPEFRAIESKSSEARSKMLSYLMAYESLPEETAAQLLSNDLLLEPLNPEEDEQFHKYLESVALQGQNAILLEEKAAVEKQLERELAEKEATKKRLEQERIEREKEKARADKAEQLLRQKEKEIASLRSKQKGDTGQSLEEINREKQARVEAENRVKEEALARAKAERKTEIYATIAAITVCFILVGLFESLIYLFKWSHPHGTGLQLAFDTLLILFTTGIFYSKWRRWCWGAGAFAILAVILQLLG